MNTLTRILCRVRRTKSWLLALEWAFPRVGGGIVIGDLRNDESNGSSATSAYYNAQLKLYTNKRKTLGFDSFTGTDYGGTGLGATILSITGDVSGTIYSHVGAITSPATFDVSNDTYITIRIASQHMPNGSNYSQTLANITLS